MKKLLFIPILLAFVACATVKVNYDYDNTADFSKYKTYQLSEESMKMTSVNQLNRDRLISAVESQMAAKGFTKSDNPDVILDIRLKSKQYQTATATTSGYGGLGYGWGRWGYGGGFTTTQVNYDDYTDGTLFVTLVDKATEKIVWQGTGTKTLDPNSSSEKKQENINSAVAQIFTQYPPAPKK